MIEICRVRLLVDFGLLILIWIVQLIIYPSFSHFSKEDLIEWHRKYTALMGFIVAPLMLAELGIYLVTLFTKPNIWNIVATVLVIIIWVMTFAQFVPMHKAISKGQVDDILLEKLVRKNWGRTVLWSILFMLGSLTCL
ncbi:hypothetical protein [Flagellimonas sp.]|uniref:hypothetical protein n=1 Tax=Flagellimonas sp. TaxID=2058762 RepID=UPI003F4A3DE5